MGRGRTDGAGDRAITGLRLIALLFGLGGLCIVVLGLWHLSGPFVNARRERRWTPVEAEVLDVRQERRTRASHDSGRKTRIVSVMTYRYHAHGAGEEHTKTVDMAPQQIAEPGRPLPVLVNPKKPERSQPQQPVGVGAYGCGLVGGAFFILFGAVFVGVCLLLWTSA